MLLLGCSQRKSKCKEAPAAVIYTGPLFRVGMLWAENTFHKVLILSARYGWISPDTIIESYDEKLTEPFSGPWPRGQGFYLGGPLYFAKAPSRFKPLVPPGRIGNMISATLLRLQTGDNPDGKGMVWWMAKWLKEKPLSKDELDVNLQELLGPMWHPRVRGTIAAQLYQARIGDHHNCWLRRDGHKYYLEPKTADNHPKLSAGWWRAL